MKYSNKIIIKKSLVLLLFWISIPLASAQTTTLTQDSKFEQLLNEKRKINSGLLLSNTYKIQIFSGTADESKKMLSAFKKDFKMYDGTILFSTPNYKVIVGNFKTRIEAEYHFNLIKKKYPTALIVKPNR